ncbi:hypothetical protein STEG23_028090, partial [Scotinomys teguina]
MCRLSWFLDPGGWGKAAVVGLYFIFPGICTLSLMLTQDIVPISTFEMAVCDTYYEIGRTVINSEVPNAGHSGAYVHMLVYVQARVHVCTCICGGQRTSGCVPYVLTTYFLEIGFLDGLELT